MIDLQQLEGQFIESNYRELEVEHSFSMAQFAPDALADLRLTGACDFEVPEWFFDLTYPGQYRRRLKAVRVSIPCVTGPYANIGATLRMTHSEIRLSAPLVGQPLAPVSTVPLRHTVSIATSKGQNDAGVFDFSFRDERYMPFEGAGAISGWSLSMPKTLRLFDYATISDVILHLDYTAQYDEGLKDRWDGAAHELLNLLSAEDESLLTRTFSLRNEFPDTFHRLVASPAGTEVTLTLESKHFPSFVTGNERKGAATAASLRIITALPGLDATAMAIGRKVDAPPQLFKEVTAPATPDVDGGELREYDLGDVFKSPLDEGGVPSDVVGPYVLKLATDSDPLGIYDIVLSIEYRLTGTTF